MQTILDAFVNRGDRVVLPDPVSPLYPLLVRTRGARIRWMSTRTEEGRLRLRFDHLSRGLRGAALLVLCSPSNPTGGVIRPGGSRTGRLVGRAPRRAPAQRRGVRSLLARERADQHRHPAAARSRTLTVGSVSKSHALASARIGWIAAHRHLLRPCLATAALRTPFVPTVSQQIALAALRTSPEAFAADPRQFESRRRYAFDRLRALG